MAFLAPPWKKISGYAPDLRRRDNMFYIFYRTYRSKNNTNSMFLFLVFICWYYDVFCFDEYHVLATGITQNTA